MIALCCAPVAPTAASDRDAAARIVVAQATAPAPAPRPGGRAALSSVVVESFAPPPEAARRATATPRPAAARAPLPTPRPARAATAEQAAAPTLTAPRPGATTARTVRAAATVPAALRRDELSLLGVFGGPDTRRALLRKPSGYMQRVRQGDRIDAWTVSAIGPESVQLRNGSRTQTLRVP